MKYSLHIRGGKEYFGEGVEGEQSFEYKLSQVNAGIEPELPEGCLPVLMEIPAMADAYSLSRLPGVLAYSSASTPAAITEFYTGELPAMGWTQVGAHKGTDGSATTVYVNEAQDQTLTIILQVVEGETWVTVHTEPLEAPMPAFMP